MLVFGSSRSCPQVFAADLATGGWLETGALPVGLLVLVIGLSLGGPTGYAINPARDLGPRMHAILPIAGKADSDWAYSWIPVVGPIVGGVLGALRPTRDLRLRRSAVGPPPPLRDGKQYA